jgi:3',5'-cyclic AMP phosphodiesterase CpdA
MGFLDRVQAENLDAVALGGDIGEAHTLEHYLEMLAQHLPCPIYFVLGNHDFYFGSILGTRQKTSAICRRHERLCWLSDARVITLSGAMALIGHDGWADGRNGDFFGSDVLLNDYFLIEELRECGKLNEHIFVEELKERGKRGLLTMLQALADESADYFRVILPKALEFHRNVILLTHVPPYREASWYGGRISTDDWLPHISCRVVGETLNSIMGKHPDKQLTVLCGHTHGAGQVQVAPNILVKTGGATYGQPEIQEIIEV